ncbi:asparaginase [candidate division KSB1 bacterium]|nr:asparaginase [candidate division KSB1 bacterium]
MQNDTIIVVITTGGTIEKSYDEKTGILVNRGSHLKKMLKRLRLPFVQIKHYNLLCKDSLEMSLDDRLNIYKTVMTSLDKDNSPIVILHGTDTMQETAQLLYEKIPNPAFPIIMTGAMRPFGFENSDALQNFTEALLAAQLIKGGIYIAMHGKIHRMPGIVKDYERGTFVKI